VEVEGDENEAFERTAPLQVGNRVVRLEADFVLRNNCFEFNLIKLDNLR